ncbi:MAG: hypothetical protein KJ709_00180 [Nanoarchaeota archaeon]|nr:hypothetical protein [Nanoarchaeota archaeon]
MDEQDDSENDSTFPVQGLDFEGGSGIENLVTEVQKALDMISDDRDGDVAKYDRLRGEMNSAFEQIIGTLGSDLQNLNHIQDATPGDAIVTVTELHKKRKRNPRYGSLIVGTTKNFYRISRGRTRIPFFTKLPVEVQVEKSFATYVDELIQGYRQAKTNLETHQRFAEAEISGADKKIRTLFDLEERTVRGLEGLKAKLEGENGLYVRLAKKKGEIEDYVKENEGKEEEPSYMRRLLTLEQQTRMLQLEVNKLEGELRSGSVAREQARNFRAGYATMLEGLNFMIGLSAEAHKKMEITYGNLEATSGINLAAAGMAQALNDAYSVQSKIRRQMTGFMLGTGVYAGKAVEGMEIFDKPVLDPSGIECNKKLVTLAQEASRKRLPGGQYAKLKPGQEGQQGQ